MAMGVWPEPENIVHEFLQQKFFTIGKLAGKKVLVTAGPTYEAIDLYVLLACSSGVKMGVAIAEELAAARGYLYILY